MGHIIECYLQRIVRLKLQKLHKLNYAEFHQFIIVKLDKPLFAKRTIMKMGYSNIYICINVQYYLLSVWSIKFAWLFGTNKSWSLRLWTLHWALIKILIFVPLTLSYYLWPIIPFMFRQFYPGNKATNCLILYLNEMTQIILFIFI